MTDTDSGRVVAEALHAVVQDHGWLAATNPTRLRAALSDLLGAAAADVRAEVDALVVAVQEGIPQRLREVGREGVPSVSPELVATLRDWGYDAGLAEWAVAAWSVVLPERTVIPSFSVPATDPGPVEQPVTDAPPATPLAETDVPAYAPTSLPPIEPEPEPAPELDPEPEPEPDLQAEREPEPEPEPEPEAEPEPTPDPEPAPASEQGASPEALGATILPPAAAAAAAAAPARTDVPPPEHTALPPSAPVAPERTNLPPSPAPASSAAPERDEPTEPSPGGTRTRRGALVLGSVAALVLAGGGVAALTLTGGDDDKPVPGPADGTTEADYTFNGKPVVDAEAVLTQADAGLRSGLFARSGKTAGAGQCYFSVPSQESSGPAEVGQALLCGPLLRLDGITPAHPFLALPLTATPEGDGIRLSAAGVERDTKAVDLPQGARLQGLDDGAPPALPEPAATGRVFPGASVSPRPVAGVLAMGSRTGGVRVTAVSPVYRFGSGDAARSRPDDGRLLAFSIGRWRCEADPCADLSKLGLEVAVGGKKPRALPRSGKKFVVSAPEGASAVDLVMTRDGITQKISLLDAEPARGNIEVLGRAAVKEEVSFSTRVTQQFYTTFADNNGTSFRQSPMDIYVRSVELRYFVAGRPVGGRDRAYAVIDVRFRRPQPYSSSGAEMAFPASALRLSVGGKEVGATYLSGESSPVFVVPASAKRATLLIGGTYSEPIGGTSYRTTTPVVRKELRF